MTADSVGVVAAARPVLADSGIATATPGLVVVTGRPPTLDFAVYYPSFAAGDTITVLAYGGEGYWTVVWRRCMTLSYQFWQEADSTVARTVRAPKVEWWVHLTDQASGQRGWILMDGVYDTSRGP
jgi:hypothetical protein